MFGPSLVNTVLYCWRKKINASNPLMLGKCKSSRHYKFKKKNLPFLWSLRYMYTNFLVAIASPPFYHSCIKKTFSSCYWRPSIATKQKTKTSITRPIFLEFQDLFLFYKLVQKILTFWSSKTLNISIIHDKLKSNNSTTKTQ